MQKMKGDGNLRTILEMEPFTKKGSNKGTNEQ